MYYKYNKVLYNRTELTQKRGSKCIDSIAVTESLFNFVEGYQLLEVNKVLDIDHRSYIVNLNLEEYFQE